MSFRVSESELCHGVRVIAGWHHRVLETQNRTCKKLTSKALFLLGLLAPTG